MKTRKPAPVAPVAPPPPSSLQDLLIQLPDTLVGLGAAKDSVDRFAAELKTNPLSAFEHMSEAIDAAAELAVAERIKELLIVYRSGSLTPRESAGRILVIAERKMVEACRSGRRMDEALGLVERRTVKAWATVYESLRHYTQKPLNTYSDDTP